MHLISEPWATMHSATKKYIQNPAWLNLKKMDVSSAARKKHIIKFGATETNDAVLAGKTCSVIGNAQMAEIVRERFL